MVGRSDGGRRVHDDVSDADVRAPEPDRFDSVADFGAALMALKQRAGASLRQLSAASGLGFSTINGYCKGRHLPQAGVGQQFRVLLCALGVTSVPDQDAWLIAADRLRRAKPVDATVANPYPGLRPYDVGDDRFFFGRESLVTELADLATGDDAPGLPVVVVGPSGAGKSSLLRAGLIPAALAERTPVLLTPGKSPVQELATALSAVISEPAEAVAERLDDDPGSIIDVLRPVLAHRSLLVVVDQLEEIFADEVDTANRERFLASLSVLATREDRPGQAAVVFGLRADFYDRALRLPYLADPLRDAQFLVPAMTEAQLRQVIAGPARAVGKDVDDAVVERILGEVAPRAADRCGQAHEPGALPLLAHVLHETFELSAGSTRLTVEHYSRTGGVAGAIARTADAAYENLAPRQQMVARRLLLSMVHVGDATAETRRRLRIDEVMAARPDSELEDLAEVLDGFISHRLLTADAESVEISHEALLAHWPRLRGWVDEARDTMRVHQRVADGTRSWMAHHRDPGELARGARLEAMRTLLDDDDADGVLLGSDEREFVTASLRAHRLRHHRLRLLAIAMTMLAVLTTAFAGLFAVARQDAATARDEALSRQMAVTARQLAADDPAAAVQLAIAGYRVAPTSDARSAMIDLASGGFPGRYPPVTGGYQSAASSSTGQRAAVSYTDDAVVRLYDVADPALARAGEVELHASPLESGENHSVALSPHGDLLAAQESMDRITLWDVADPRRPTRLGSMTGPHGVHDLAFASDGAELAAVGPADDVYRWDISDPTAPAERARIRTPGPLHAVAYGPGGDVLAVGTEDAKVEHWAIDGGPKRLADLSAGEGRVTTVSFSPDGGTLTAGTALGRTVSVWDIGDPRHPRQREIADPQFDSWVNRAVFSPDGSLFLAASSESVVRVWDTSSWETIVDLPHPSVVGWVGFGSSHVALTATDDGSLWRWDLRTAVPRVMPGRAWRTGFAADTGQLAVFAEGEANVWPPSATGILADPEHIVADNDGEQSIGDGDITADGSLLAHSYVGGTVSVFDLSGAGEPARLSEFTADTVNIVQSLAISPDGNLIATGGDDTTVRLHDISDPRRPTLVTELDDGDGKVVLGVRWQPQGELLAVASAGGTVSIYDVSDPDNAHRVGVLEAFDGDVHLAEFSPDGTRLAAAGLDGLIRLWDVSDPANPVPLGAPITGPVNAVPKLTFHPDGTMLAATDSKGAIWVFDISDPQNPTRHTTLTPGIGQMNSLAFHPDGAMLAAASVPGVVRVWQLDHSTIVERVCATVGEPITEEQWRTHLPDVEYRPPC